MTPATWAYVDFLLVTVATWGVHAALVHFSPGYNWMTGPLLSGLALGGCITFSGLVFGLYERRTLGARSRILVRSALTLALGLILAYACIFVFFYGAMTRWLGLCVVVLYSVVTIPLRVVAHEAITCGRRRVLFVGCGDSIRKVVRTLKHGTHSQVAVIGHLRVVDPPTMPADSLSPASADNDELFVRACPYLGTVNQLEHTLRDYDIDEVVIGAELSSSSAVDQTVLACLEQRRRVTDQPTFIEKLLGEVPADDIDTQWFLQADVQSIGGYETAKRIVDVISAVVGLVLTLPLWLLIAVIIQLDSRGPAFFKQRREGLHGRVFTIYKFRTMCLDAEANGACWAGRNDPRVTRFGRLLRLTRLDELPQLWNILKGEMSLVGPRPERPEFTEDLVAAIPHYRQRNLVKPGLSGWAQINYRYGSSIADTRRKLCFDLYYLKYRSLDLDFAIIIRTIGTFLLGAR
ncbi:MAG: sugar transferase [Planctomycetota bacterium]